MLRDLILLGVLLMFFSPGTADDSSLAKLPIEQKVIPNRSFPPGYSAAIQPNPSGNTTVIGYVDVTGIKHISEKEKFFIVKANLTLFWNDTRLIVGQEEKSLEASEIRQLWLPHITVKNLVQQPNNPQPLDPDHMTKFGTHILVLPGGRVRLERAISARLGMDLKLYEYPNDEQWCNIILTIDPHRSRSVNLRLQKSNRKKEDITAPGTFDVHHYQLNKRGNSFFVSLGVTRVMSHQHLQLYLPCYLIVLLSWIPVYTPYRRNTRIKLSFSAVLTMMTFAAGFRSTLPKTKHIKLIDVYLLFCIITVWFSLFSVLMLTWVKSNIFCRFMCFSCKKDDPKDAVGKESSVRLRPVRLPHRRRHEDDQKRHHEDDHKRRYEDDHKRRYEDDDDFDDDDSDAENNLAVQCNRPTKLLRDIFCCPLIKLMFGLTYLAPLVFIAFAILYHLKYGIYHLHKLSVKQ